MARRSPGPSKKKAAAHAASAIADRESLDDLDPEWMQRFRAIALGMPGAVEKPHWSRPSFAAPGKGKKRGGAGPIFAVLWPDEGKAVLKFTPEQQEELIAAKPGMYEPVPGAWGERGYTLVRLKGKGAAGAREVKRAVEMAWENVSPTPSRAKDHPPNTRKRVHEERPRPRRRQSR